ncbi:MAG TPA: SCO family protein [Nocardioidaceae bacterium]|nr:SCO family protein [Nocardioidaceae bacterium]
MASTRHRLAVAAAAALAGVLTLSACGGNADEGQALTSGLTVHTDDGMNGAVLTDQYVIPDTTLTATDGAAYSLTADTTKPVTLVFFGYTNCPDICQAVMADIASAMTRLDSADRDRVDMLFITTDPARDDPAALREYLDRFNPQFEGLTGDLQRIVKIGNELGVAIEKGAKMPSGGYEVAHGTQIIAINAKDRAPIVWTEGTSAGDLAADITELLHPNG